MGLLCDFVPFAHISALVVSCLLLTINDSRLWHAVTTASRALMLSTIAFLFLCFFARRAQASVTYGAATVLSAAQKLATYFVA